MFNEDWDPYDVMEQHENQINLLMENIMHISAAHNALSEHTLRLEQRLDSLDGVLSEVNKLLKILE